MMAKKTPRERELERRLADCNRQLHKTTQEKNELQRDLERITDNYGLTLGRGSAAAKYQRQRDLLQAAFSVGLDHAHSEHSETTARLREINAGLPDKLPLAAGVIRLLTQDMRQLELTRHNAGEAAKHIVPARAGDPLTWLHTMRGLWELAAINRMMAILLSTVNGFNNPAIPCYLLKLCCIDRYTGEYFQGGIIPAELTEILASDDNIGWLTEEITGEQITAGRLHDGLSYALAYKQAKDAGGITQRQFAAKQSGVGVSALSKFSGWLTKIIEYADNCPTELKKEYEELLFQRNSETFPAGRGSGV
jgi:hypothetical protein